MDKSNHIFSVVNIIVFLLFTAGFFIGTVMYDSDSRLPCLSANSAMIFKEKQENTEYINIISKILPLVNQVKPPASVPPINTNYTPEVPVLASDSVEKIKIKNDTGYEIDVKEILNEKITVKNAEVKVLILHTHTSEAYMMDGDDVYDESDPYRTQNSEKNIVRIGDVIEEELKKRGIGVVHDRTYHDYPSYTGSYKRALSTGEKLLKEHSDVTLVLDIHRDALLNEGGEYMKTYTEIEGEGCAQALIVIGSNGGGLVHDRWRENLKYGLKLQEVMQKKYPTLTRPLHLCNERYNGHMGDGAMIIEIGSNANTLSEAEKCARLVGECIADFIFSPENQ